MQTASHRAKTGYRFADLCLETGRRRILRGREDIPLTGLPFAILRELVEAAPNLVTHEELIERAWGPGRIVTPESLAQNIKRLRKALGADPFPLGALHAEPEGCSRHTSYSSRSTA